MAVRQLQLSTWERLVKQDGHRAKLSGDSPGGVAARLGCSRQFVHSLIKRGLLDAVAVYQGDRLAFYVVPEPSLLRYQEGKRRLDEAQAARYP